MCADRLDLITKQVISKGGAVPRRTHADKPFIPQRHNFRKLSEVDVFRIRTCMLRSPVFSRVDELVSTIQRHEAGEQDVGHGTPPQVRETKHETKYCKY